MQIIEQQREITEAGETITIYQAGKRTIRLIGMFGEGAKLEDLLYSIACEKIVDKLDRPSTSL